MYHSSWSAEAKVEFEKCILAHGGWDAWNNFNNFTFSFKKFNGVLLFVKGLGRNFHTPDQITIIPKSKTAIFDYGYYSDQYKDGLLYIHDKDLTIIEGRQIFKQSTFEQWTPEHALYFFGSALVNYISYPFILPQFELLSFKVNNYIRTFEIKFPESYRTHSIKQKFFFGEDDLLQKHTYRSRLAGPFVFGDHSTEDYKNFKGLMIAQTRKVRPRLGPCSLPAYGIYAELDF